VDPSALEAVVSWTIIGDDAPWTIELQKSADGTFYAMSTFNRAPVELTQSLAGEVVADLEEIFAVE
jgi:hypothetical protein